MKTHNCPQKQLKGGWRKVICIIDLDEDTLACPCGLDYSEQCACPGPMESGFEYKTVRGKLFGRRIHTK